MARFAVQDQAEYIFFTEGVVPTPTELLGRFPNRAGPPIPLHELPADVESQRAWLLTLHAYQLANMHGYERAFCPPLETWIVGRPRGPPGVFADWFAGEGEDYRLLINRIPLLATNGEQYSREAALCWARTYARVQLPRKRMPTAALAAPVQAFLSQVHHAYRENPAALPDMFAATGHNFARSEGPTKGFDKRRLWRRF